MRYKYTDLVKTATDWEKFYSDQRKREQDWKAEMKRMDEAYDKVYAEDLPKMQRATRNAQIAGLTGFGLGGLAAGGLTYKALGEFDYLKKKRLTRAIIAAAVGALGGSVTGSIAGGISLARSNA